MDISQVAFMVDTLPNSSDSTEEETDAVANLLGVQSYEMRAEGRRR